MSPEIETVTRDDAASLIKIAQVVSGDLQLDVLVDHLLVLLRDTAGAETAALVLGDMAQAADDTGMWMLTGHLPAGSDVVGRPGRLLEECASCLPVVAIGAAIRTGVPTAPDLGADMAGLPGRIGHAGPVSALCLPLVKQGKAIGALYLENDRVAGLFTEERIAFLDLVSGQIVNAIENARLYGALARSADVLEARVADRTRQLEASEQRMRDALVNLPIPTLVTRLDDGQILFVNPRGAAQFGLTVEEALQQKAGNWYANPADRAVVVDLIARNARFADLEMRLRDRHGRIRWVMMSGEIFDFDGERAMLTTLIDITDRRQTDIELRHHAERDGLTGLLNRRTFTARLHGWMHRPLPDRQPLALLYMDLDRFKRINDTFGHGAGDRLLKAFADRLTALMPEGALATRLGGDEFVLAIMASPQQSVVIAETILDAMRRDHDIDGHIITARTTIGIACQSNEDETLDSLMKKADLALYQAKEAGRDTYRLFDGHLQENHAVRLQLEGDMRHALKRQEFHLHFQPLVCLRSGEVRSVEALLRWDNPRAGPITPAQFIPVAEETGLIAALGDWVLHEACRRAAEMPGSTGIAVNISPVQFRRRSLSDSVLDALRASGLAAERLTLEVTENVLLGAIPDVSREMHRLKEIGVRLSIDDFGTGFSGLGYLRGFPFDQIKIDRSFVSDVTKDRNAGLIIAAIANLAQGLGMTVVAEGIETIEQLVAVKSAGCSEGQGYFFSKPAAVVDFRAYSVSPPPVEPYPATHHRDCR